LTAELVYVNLSARELEIKTTPLVFHLNPAPCQEGVGVKATARGRSAGPGFPVFRESRFFPVLSLQWFPKLPVRAPCHSDARYGCCSS